MRSTNQREHATMKTFSDFSVIASFSLSTACPQTKLNELELKAISFSLPCKLRVGRKSPKICRVGENVFVILFSHFIFHRPQFPKEERTCWKLSGLRTGVKAVSSFLCYKLDGDDDDASNHVANKNMDCFGRVRITKEIVSL